MRGCIRSFVLAVMILSSVMLPAFAFNYDRYVVTDLDALLAQGRPRKGVDIHPALPLKLKVTLAAYGTPCDTGLLRRSQVMAGLPKEFIDGVKVTRCIEVRSAKGKALRVFIQDEVSAFLPKEIPIGGTVTLYAIHLFTDTGGPGLLVNDFWNGEGDRPGKPAREASSGRAVAARASVGHGVGGDVQ